MRGQREPRAVVGDPDRRAIVAAAIVAWGETGDFGRVVEAVRPLLAEEIAEKIEAEDDIGDDGGYYWQGLERASTIAREHGKAQS